MAKRKKISKPASNNSNYIIPIEKKKKIFAVLLIVFSALIFLSIISYSRRDLANLSFDFSDILKIFSNDSDISHRASEIHNWLGIFGAYISNFFINATLGYFSVVFPMLMFFWGMTIFQERDSRSAVYLSNWLLLIAFILAALLGVFRFELNIWIDLNELSGKIGGFFGAALGKLLGGVGSIIFLTVLFFICLFIAFDVRFTWVVNLFKYLSSRISEKFSDEDQIAETKDQKLNNLSKIEKLGKKKSRLPKIIPSGDDDEEAESAEPGTRIRIVQKEVPEQLIEDEPEEQPAEKVKPVVKPVSRIKEIGEQPDKDMPEQWEETIKFAAPKLELLKMPKEEDVEIPKDELKRNAELLKEKLKLFDIQIEDITVTPGPVVTLYEIVPAPGVKISRIVSLEHDIALALAARGIRIIAPIPGKSAIGVEIPNSSASLVSARSVIAKIKESKAELPLALGKTIAGDVYITDLALLPHLLIAGSTGSGKSVGINMMITSLLYSKHPSDVKFIIIDPKKIELSFYKRLSKHYLAIAPDLDEEIITNPQNALLALKAVEYEMENRYDKLAKIGVRNIIDYNKKVSNPKSKPKDTDEMKHHKLPYLIIIIDELADLMITAGKEVEEPIARLAQLARAVGIHLILATQRPSVNVITGVIKANFSARIAYQVATRIDSRTILDMNGAEALLGRGDMLYLPGGMPKPVRIQNAFISTEEVERVTNYIYIQKGFSKRYFLPSMFEKKKQTTSNFLAELDPMFEDAARVIVRSQQGSVSLLQRRLKLGYARAARIVDQLEEAGIVGPSSGSKARNVIVENEEQLEAVLRSL